MNDPLEQAEGLVNLEKANDDLRETCPFVQGFDYIYDAIYQGFETDAPETVRDAKAMGFEFISASVGYSDRPETLMFYVMVIKTAVAEYYVRKLDRQE